MNNKLFRNAWIITLFVSGLLACTLVSQIGRQVGDVRETAQSAATGIDQGQGLLNTVQAVGTQVGISGFEETAMAVVTKIDESGLEETAMAYATEFRESGLDETAQAFVTQEVPGLFETAQAMVTNQGPGLEETAQAFATQLASSMGQTPEDIPLIESEREDFFSSESMVSYSTPTDFVTALNFYKTEMPKNGWTAVEQGSVETSNAAILNYGKADRNASVTISLNPGNSQTIILISIQKK